MIEPRVTSTPGTPLLPWPAFRRTVTVAGVPLRSTLIRKIAARLEERAGNVSVQGTTIFFSGVSERDAGKKNSMLSSSSSGTVSVDEASGKVSYALSFRKTIVKCGLYISLLAIPVYMHDEPPSTYLPLAGVWVVFVAANVLTEALRFAAFIDRVINDTGSESA